MTIKFDLSDLSKTKWHEYGVRFLFGGAITVVAGLLAKQFGPVFGGLFLAFPAIFPASATLVESHERERKQKAGISRTNRGREAAALDAWGAVMGSVGLTCFAYVVWKELPFGNAAIVLTIALFSWLFVSLLLWRASKIHL
jgi:Protein of unknown function (DUF3147)